MQVFCTLATDEVVSPGRPVGLEIQFHGPRHVRDMECNTAAVVAAVVGATSVGDVASAAGGGCHYC